MKNTKPVSKNNYRLDLQIAAQSTHTPSRYYFQRWIKTVLLQQKIKQAEITVRVAGKQESARLNETYRHKKGPTNVLSFPFTAPPGMSSALLGDLIICAPIVAQEAKMQKKLLRAHWAHMVIHGVLHLLGHDHIKPKEAELMEATEIKILQQLGFANPYE